MKHLLSPEWIWRYLVALFLIANVYLQSRYVTREEYSADKKELSNSLLALNMTITSLKIPLELLKQSAGQLGDHETRIRILERRP
jgi:regulatory protein YycI of two-component signal transduction system YycFG